MASRMGAILRSGHRKKDEKLNILCMPTHERYQTDMAKTGHTFLLYRDNNIKEWNTTFAPLPANCALLEKKQFPPLDVDIDIVLSQNKFGQYPIAKHFSRLYNCPLICLEHTLPPKEWTPNIIEESKQYTGDVNVFIGKYSLEKWGFKPMECVVIGPGVDTEIFKPAPIIRKPYLLSVVNDWINRDWCCGFKLWQDVSKNLPVKVIGDTPGLSKPAKDVAELVQNYQEAAIYLNTSLISTCPVSMLEAMACGCAVVSTATSMIPEVINHGVNGFISNDPKDLREFCLSLLRNPKLAERIGKAARRTMLAQYSIENFVREWNGLFNYTAENVFVKD